MVLSVAEGGIVSTAADTMRFVRAIFTGRFFPPETVETLKEWNRIHVPGQFDFGIGLEKQWTHWFLPPFDPIDELLGFRG